jgi:hypothetical protein
MFIVRFKNLNSQAALGMGYTATDSVIKNIGDTDNKGMYYGDPSASSKQIKCHGIEDLWGNGACYIDGTYSNGKNCHATMNNFNNYDDYTLVGTSEANSGKIKKVIGTTNSGFLAQTSGASDTTYYCDNFEFYVNEGRTSAQMGIGPIYGTVDGIFYLRFRFLLTQTDNLHCGRLMYL